MVLAVSSGVLSERSPSFFRHVLCLLEQFTTGKGSFVEGNERQTETRPGPLACPDSAPHGHARFPERTDLSIGMGVASRRRLML